MLDCVPDPVCQITKGNSPSCCPVNISSQTAEIRAHFSVDKTPSAKFVCAAAFLTIANAWIISSGIEAAGPILKLLRDRSVCAPQ